MPRQALRTTSILAAPHPGARDVSGAHPPARDGHRQPSPKTWCHDDSVPGPQRPRTPGRSVHRPRSHALSRGVLDRQLRSRPRRSPPQPWAQSCSWCWRRPPRRQATPRAGIVTEKHLCHPLPGQRGLRRSHRDPRGHHPQTVELIEAMPVWLGGDQVATIQPQEEWMPNRRSAAALDVDLLEDGQFEFGLVRLSGTNRVRWSSRRGALRGPEQATADEAFPVPMRARGRLSETSSPSTSRSTNWSTEVKAYL